MVHSTFVLLAGVAVLVVAPLETHAKCHHKRCSHPANASPAPETAPPVAVVAPPAPAPVAGGENLGRRSDAGDLNVRDAWEEVPIYKARSFGRRAVGVTVFTPTWLGGDQKDAQTPPPPAQTPPPPAQTPPPAETAHTETAPAEKPHTETAPAEKPHTETAPSQTAPPQTPPPQTPPGETPPPDAPNPHSAAAAGTSAPPVARSFEEDVEDLVARDLWYDLEDLD